MKKFILIIIVFIASLFFLTSCPVCCVEPPNINVTPEKDTVLYTEAREVKEVAFTVKITQDVTNDETLKTFNVYESSITNEVFYTEGFIKFKNYYLQIHCS